MKAIENPIVSVDRDSSTIAAFDGPEIVHPFEEYDPRDEDAAITSMKIWLAFNGAKVEPKVVYPRITKLIKKQPPQQRGKV